MKMGCSSQASRHQVLLAFPPFQELLVQLDPVAGRCMLSYFISQDGDHMSPFSFWFCDKHYDPNEHGKGRIDFSLQFQVAVHHQGQVPVQAHSQLSFIFLHCLASHPQEHSPGMMTALLIVGWALPHKSLSKKMPHRLTYRPAQWRHFPN